MSWRTIWKTAQIAQDCDWIGVHRFPVRHVRSNIITKTTVTYVFVCRQVQSVDYFTLAKKSAVLVDRPGTQVYWTFSEPI